MVFWFYDVASRFPEEALKNYLRQGGWTDEQIVEFLKSLKTFKEG